MNIFVGNLSFDTTEADLKKLFEGFGIVTSLVIVMDEKGKKSRGFGFLEMADGQQAEKAIAALDGRDFMGRPIRVNPAKPKSQEDKELGDQKELRKRIKVEKRQMAKPEKFLGGRRTLRTVRLTADQRRAQPKPWEKREAGSKPWQKREGGAKPWEKREGGAKPWQKREGGAKPWEKREGSAKPWQKHEVSARPWQKRQGSAKPWEKREERTATPWKRTDTRAKPDKRTPGKSRPWEKRPGVAKPWQKNKTRGYQR